MAIDREQIIELCRKAGFSKHEGIITGGVSDLERFADLVAAAAKAEEREVCAKVCDDLPAPPHVSRDDATVWDVATLDCAEAIRARSGETK